MAYGLGALIVFRVMQAAGAALMTPTSLGLLLASFSPEERGGAVRTWTAIGGFAAALGPMVGGVLLTVSWRWIFIVNVPIGLLALMVGWLRLPEVPGHDVPRPDPWGAFLVTAGIAALIFGIVKVNAWGWWSPVIGSSFLLAVILLGFFILQCLRSPNPFVDPALFKIRPFTGAVLVMAPYSAAFGAMLLSIALWLQSAWNWSPLHTGLAIAPGPLLVPTTSLLFARRLIGKFGAATVVAAGIACFIAGMACWTGFIGLTPDIRAVIPGMVLTGIGVGLAFPTLMGVGTAALPASSFATGSGVINMVRQAALAVGVAIFVAIVGSPSSPGERLAAFDRGWWVIAAITAIGFIPAFLFIRSRRGPVEIARVGAR